MTIRFLNCFTCDGRFNDWRTGTLCLLLETNNGLTLVDTGLGLADYENPTLFTQFFRLITIMPFDPQEAAINQIQRLGYKPKDLKHIILTHMHFDHCGGMSDFPHAKVHVYRKEYEAFTGVTKGFLGAAYNQRHIAHKPDFIFYEDSGEKWFEFDAIHIKGFVPAMWFIPMPHHSRGLCGIAIKTTTGWHFHCSDAAADFNHPEIPAWSIRLILGPYMHRLRKFAADHPEIRMTASHMFKEFFEED
jgi:glyoxylase-like metal-dependent hydrolase (beta-lactamase superfamily II)